MIKRGPLMIFPDAYNRDDLSAAIAEDEAVAAEDEATELEADDQRVMAEFTKSTTARRADDPF